MQKSLHKNDLSIEPMRNALQSNKKPRLKFIFMACHSQINTTELFPYHSAEARKCL